jgi:hypothetical protein
VTHPRRQQSLDSIVWCSHATDPDRRPHCALTATIRFGAVALCGPCASRRSTVGKGQPGVALPPSPTIDLRSWIAAAQHDANAAERTLRAAVSRARQAGLAWSVIGAQLGVSRQAAQQRFAPNVNADKPPAGLTPEHTHAHHHDADADDPEVVPSHWRKGGPITLASDIQRSAVGCAWRRLTTWSSSEHGEGHPSPPISLSLFLAGSCDCALEPQGPRGFELRDDQAPYSASSRLRLWLVILDGRGAAPDKPQAPGRLEESRSVGAGAARQGGVASRLHPLPVAHCGRHPPGHPAELDRRWAADCDSSPHRDWPSSVAGSGTACAATRTSPGRRGDGSRRLRARGAACSLRGRSGVASS